MKRFLLFLILPLFFACKKNDQPVNLTTNQTFSADCLKEAKSEDTFRGTCFFDSIRHCELIEIPDKFLLTDENKEWLKPFCLNDFDKIFFHNEAGEETYLEVTGRSFLDIKSGAIFPECPNDTTRFVSYCMRSEIATVDFRVPIAKTTFVLELTNRFGGSISSDIQQSLGLRAYTFNSSGSSALFPLIHHLNIQPENQNSIFQTFFPEIEILGKTFDNVYSSNDGNSIITSNPDALQFFYNKEFGIVSFIDNNGTQWVLND